MALVPSTLQATERIVRVHGLDIFVRERGTGFPLLLINGIGANVDMWGETESQLAQNARVISFDAPGTGRSGTPIFPLPMTTLGKIATGVLDELGHEGADVLGFSFGGLVAQQVAHAAPERVRRLGLVSTTCGWGCSFGDPAALSLLATPARYYSRAFGEQTSGVYGPRDSSVEESIRAARLAWPPSSVGYAYQLLAAASWSSLSWLPSLRAPTLVIAGLDDRVTVPANGVQITRLIPQSRLHLLPHEGHLALFDPRSGATALLADYFASKDYASSDSWTFGLPGDDGLDGALAA